MPFDHVRFVENFAEFKVLYARYGGHPFTSLREGMAASWEGYKPRLRDKALEQLAPDQWTAADVGTGRILDAAISAIELSENNLVFWPNRYGHATRDHAALLDARDNKSDRAKIEQALFDLYSGLGDESPVFTTLQELTHRKYPLLAYLFFLKDAERYMPLQPTGFDRVFKAMSIDLETRGNCSYVNYSAFNSVLREVASALEAVAALKNVRLVDAHSFCWIYSKLLRDVRPESQQDSHAPRFGKHADPGHVLGARERSVYQMKQTIIDTASYARGQTVERLVQIKQKDLAFDSYALERHLRDLMERQQDRCALTGIPFHFHGEDADASLLPSADRIDSDKNYEPGNIQIVCRFVNFWKGATPNAEFARLLGLIRSGGNGAGVDGDSFERELGRSSSAYEVGQQIRG